MAADRIVFVSDAHFGSGAHEPERRASFIRFLDSQTDTRRLVIVGDLFQFWFDLGRTMPKGYFDILDALYRLRRNGTGVDYLAGNHDYWRSDFFERELGIQTHPGELEIAAQGRRIWVAHGDGLGPGDRGYKMLQSAVRAPAVVGAARLLHPDLLHAIAFGLGRWSRSRAGAKPPDVARLRAVAASAWSRGFDAVVLGHVHTQLHERGAQGELVVIGDWLALRSYVRLENGAFATGRAAEGAAAS